MLVGTRLGRCRQLSADCCGRSQAEDSHLRANIVELMKLRTAESFRKYQVLGPGRS
jgi:hypothetical protein